MTIKQYRLDVSDLALGMFVSKLDRPWTHTPFPIQGFYIHDYDEIRMLKFHCKHVYIDVDKGVQPEITSKLHLAPRGVKKEKVKPPESARINKKKVIPHLSSKLAKPTLYPEIKPLKSELAKARTLNTKITRSMSDIFALVKMNEHSRTVRAKETVNALVEGVLRCPDAFIWLNRMSLDDHHSYQHAIRCSVWAILLGRDIGLENKALHHLAMAVLFKDFGKVKLPKRILQAQERNAEDEATYQTFIQHSATILERMSGVPKAVINAVYCHCERLNGSGFPRQLPGEKIPLIAQLAGIVSYYDDLVAPRHGPTLSPSKALAKLFAVADKEFYGELVEAFIQAIGLNPIGTLVQLNTGALAVILDSNKQRRLRPRILVVTDAYQVRLLSPYAVDLSGTDTEEDGGLGEGQVSPAELEILHDLPDGYADLDVHAIRKAYIAKQQEKTMLNRLKNIFGLSKHLDD